MRSLVVNNQEGCWISMQFLLSVIGFDQESCTSNSKALELFRDSSFDFVFIDEGVENGLELVGALRAIEEGKPVPIFLVVPKGGRDDALSKLKDDHFLVMEPLPIALEQFAELVRQAFQHKQ